MLKCLNCNTWGKCEHEKDMPITEKRSTYKKQSGRAAASPPCVGNGAFCTSTAFMSQHYPVRLISRGRSQDSASASGWPQV